MWLAVMKQKGHLVKLEEIAIWSDRELAKVSAGVIDMFPLTLEMTPIAAQVEYW